MKKLKSSWIIHGFALLHFATAWLSVAAAIPDSRMLTLMTILMTVILCMRENVNLIVTGLCIVLANILGYYFGMEIKEDFAFFSLDSELPSLQAVSSLITTEILGWIMYLFFRYFGKSFQVEEDYWNLRFPWVLLLVGVVYGVRLLISTVIQADLYAGLEMYDYFHQFLLNYILLVVLLALDVAQVHLTRRLQIGWRLLIAVPFLFVTASAAAFFAAAKLPFGWTGVPPWLEILRFLVVAVVVQMALLSLTSLVTWSLSNRKAAVNTRNEAHKAQFQYQNLKQQLNPHFLFNSLNVLNSLVLDERSGEASSYIVKLSGLYRYMLQSEKEKLVPLQRELEYVRMYVDLLKLRFSEGLEVDIAVADRFMDRDVIPCSVQLLVENAVKHNTIQPDQPLRIRIYEEDGYLVVRNNFQPKNTAEESHGVGQSYIRQQYKDAGVDIRIEPGESEYYVYLPLL